MLRYERRHVSGENKNEKERRYFSWFKLEQYISAPSFKEEDKSEEKGYM